MRNRVWEGEKVNEDRPGTSWLVILGEGELVKVVAMLSRP